MSEKYFPEFWGTRRAPPPKKNPWPQSPMTMTIDIINYAI